MEITRRALIRSASILGYANLALAAPDDPLASWNDGAAKRAVVEFVRATTTQGGPTFVPPAARIVTFDQDGTTWVEHPIYTQVLFAYDRLAAIAPEHPEWKTSQPFQSVLTGDKKAMSSALESTGSSIPAHIARTTNFCHIAFLRTL